MEPSEMGSISIWHFLIAIIFTVVMMYPYVRIIQKAGYSGWWILVGIVPLLNLVMLWVFALTTWPVERRARSEDVF
ncbi:hypothetical protein [Dongia sp.]|uniref:hypothetical protein n=1 Tax=Dongia sp. TaxID=1977262 RepID=UPI0035B17795